MDKAIGALIGYGILELRFFLAKMIKEKKITGIYKTIFLVIEGIILISLSLFLFFCSFFYSRIHVLKRVLLILCGLVIFSFYIYSVYDLRNVEKKIKKVKRKKKGK